MNFTLETREGLLQAISYLEEDRESTNALEKLAFKCLQKAQELNEQDLEYRVRIALIVIHNDLHKTECAHTHRGDRLNGSSMIIRLAAQKVDQVRQVLRQHRLPQHPA